MNKESIISIFVKSMRVNVRIGLEDFEKVDPQAVDVSIELFTPVDYLKNDTDRKLIDYAILHDAIKAWETREHVELIETYLNELVDLAFTFGLVTACRVSISKPDIFEAAERAGVEAFILRKDWMARS